MNKKELYAMTAEQLRDAIAKKHGWEYRQMSPDPNRWYTYSPSNNDGWWGKDGEWFDAYHPPFPDWTGELNDAMQLVVEAAAKKVGFNLCNLQYSRDDSIEYSATFFDPWGGPNSREYQMEHKDPAMAISLAWMLMEEAQ